MKKLLFVLSLITVQSFGQSVPVIIASSFDTINAILPNTTQWVDVYFKSSIYVNQGFHLMIESKLKNSSFQSMNLKVFDTSYSVIATESIIRVKFTVPVQVRSGSIYENLNGHFLVYPNSPSYKDDIGNLINRSAFGIVNNPTTTGLNDLDYSSSEQIKEVFYYNLNGVKIENPDNYDGVLIKRNVYLNGASSSIKILQSYKY